MTLLELISSALNAERMQIFALMTRSEFGETRV